MKEQTFINLEWYCCHCGGSGSRKLWADLCIAGTIAELVLSHSLNCPGCVADARTTLRLRRPSHSDSDWEQLKEKAKARAANTEGKRLVRWGVRLQL